MMNSRARKMESDIAHDEDVIVTNCKLLKFPSFYVQVFFNLHCSSEMGIGSGRLVVAMSLLSIGRNGGQNNEIFERVLVA